MYTFAVHVYGVRRAIVVLGLAVLSGNWQGGFSFKTFTFFICRSKLFLIVAYNES